jgi:transcription antitermination factor NusG
MPMWPLWSVVRIQSPRVGLRNLAAVGVTPFYPCFAEKRVVRGVITQVDVPLFSTYCFCLIPENFHWPKLNNIYGCGKLMTRRSESSEYNIPVSVDPAFIAQLKQCTHYEGADRWTLAVGTKVTITAGPFRGHTGEIAKMNGTERVHLLLWMLGRQTVVTVSRVDIAPVEA